MDANNVLKEGVYNFIKINPNCDSVEIMGYFKDHNVNSVIDAIMSLRSDNKINRKHLYGSNYGYIINK